jgi:hypothetical protein
MGRHDDPDPAPFYTSLGSAILRGLLALVLSFGLYAALQIIRNDDGPQPVALEGSEQPASQAREMPMFIPPETAVGSEEAEVLVAPSENRSEAAEEEALLSTRAPRPENITVQVLDGGAGQRRTGQVVDRLKRHGYRIVAVNKAVRNYTATTVFYSEGQASAAEDLQGRDTRFANIRPNSDLSEEVDLHILVGTDWK